MRPELDDAFAKELGDYETIEDLKQKLREHMRSDKKNRADAWTRNRLLDALVTRFEFPVPESLVQSQIDARLERGLRALAAQGMRTEDMRKMDFGRLREGQRDSAVNEVKGTILLDRIADAENVQVDDEELEREIQLLSLQSREPLDSLEAGTAAVHRLVTDPGLAGVTGRYFDRDTDTRANGQAYDPAARARLWQASLELVGHPGI